MDHRLSIGLVCVRDPPLQLRGGSPEGFFAVGVSPRLVVQPSARRQLFLPELTMLPSRIGTCPAAKCSLDA